MAQPSVSSFFITRKRGIEDDVVASKNKVICLEKNPGDGNHRDDDGDFSNKIVYPTTTPGAKSGPLGDKSAKVTALSSVRQGITPQRTRSSRRVQMQNVDGIETPKVATFFFGGTLSPQKKAKQQLEPPQVTPIKESSIREPVQEINHGLKTPTKRATPSSTLTIEKTLLMANNSLNTDELKKKLRGSSRLTDLKTSLNKLRNGFDKLDQMEKRRTGKAPDTPQSPSLKPFRNIELEILR
jgi:hypothetical protein